MLKSLINNVKALALGDASANPDSGHKADLHDLFPKVDKAVDGEDCDHDCASCDVKYPKWFRIDETDKFYGNVKAWSTHLVVATGKSDWIGKIEYERGSVMQAVEGGKKPSNGRLLLSASDMPTPHGTTSYAEPTTVLLLPAFLFIDNVTPASVPTLIESVVSRAPTTASPLEPFSIPASIPCPPPHAEHILTTRRCQHRAVILLCSHKTRDARCGASAPLLRKELRRHLEPRGLWRDHDDERPGGVGVYFVSHVGGHGYAANMLVYRRGGNWEVEDAAAAGGAPVAKKDDGSKEEEAKKGDDARKEDESKQGDEAKKGEEGEEGTGKAEEGQEEGKKKDEDGGEGSDKKEEGDVGASQCIWLARVRPEDCEGIVKFTVIQGKVVKPERQLRGGFDRARGLLSW